MTQQATSQQPPNATCSTFASSENTNSGAPTKRQALKWLYGFLRPHKAGITKLACLSIVTTLLVVAQPYLTKQIIDEGLLKSNFDALLLFATSLLLIGFLTTFLAAINRIRHTRLSGQVLFALREDVYGHLLKLPTSFFHDQRTGDIISRVDRDVAEIQRFAVDTLFSTFSSVIGLICATAMMVHLNWRLSLVLLVLIPVEFLYLYKMRPKVERRNIEVRNKGADISAFFAEKIPAIKFIQSMASEEHEINTLASLNKSFLHRLIALQKTEIWTSAIPSSLVSLSRAGIFIIGGYWVIHGEFTIGSLIAFTTYVGMAIAPTQSLLGLYLAWQRLTVSLDRVAYLRQQPVAEFHGNTVEPPSTFKGKLTIEDLCFSYTRQEIIFDQATTTIPAGSMVGIKGRSGIGKSTLLDLLQKHLAAKSGRFIIDDLDIATFQTQQWRQRIAVAPQEPVIFRESLANNIRYGRPSVNDNEVMQAAKAAGLQELIKKLPKGVETIISERGSMLSGGERQRIGLARTLLQKPAILILDEPTSATDAALEESIVNSIRALFPTTTCLLVSHRDSVLRRADYILSIDNKQLSLRPRENNV